MAGRFGTPNGPEARMERFLRGRSAPVKPGAPAERFGALKSLGLKHAERHPAHPDSRSGYRSACLSPRDLSAPNHSAGAPGFTGALLPLRNRSIRASGPFGVPRDLSAPNLPAIFGLFQLRPGSFSTSFSFLISFRRINCAAACFVLLVHLCLSLSLFFSFT